MGIPIVGKFFRADVTLYKYVAGAQMGEWRPDFVVLHNTGDPTLSMRPAGFTGVTLGNLADYYAGLGWHAGPHWFVDQNGCWAFSAMDAPGVHSPSWNGCSWGVEMLGDYETEAFGIGASGRVRDNAVMLLACLHKRAGLDSHTLRFHKEDVLTTHKDCPGRGVDKADMIARVHDLLLEWERPLA